MTIAENVNEHVMPVLENLPQVDQIPEERVNKWLRLTTQVEMDRIDVDRPEDGLVDRILWHANRLYGIGGSEIGVLIEHTQGVDSPFTSAREIIAGKLMHASPEPSEGQLLRGSYMEPLIRRVFLRSYNAKQDTQALEQFAKTGIDPAHPWHTGNPDDIVQINGRRYLVDYKCPSPDYCETVVSMGMSLEYAAQLHYYAMKAKRSGIQIDGMLLAPVNTNMMRVYALECPWDQELADEITAVGDMFWAEYVLAGKLPDYIERPDENEFIADPTVEAMAQSATYYKALSSYASTQFERIKQDLIQSAKDTGMVGTGRMQVGAVKLASKDDVNYDIERMRRILSDNDIDEKQFIEKTKTTFDQDAMYEAIVALQDSSINLRDIKSVRTQFRVNFPTARAKSVEAEMFRDMKVTASGMIEESVNALATLSAGEVVSTQTPENTNPESTNHEDATTAAPQEAEAGTEASTEADAEIIQAPIFDAEVPPIPAIIDDEPGESGEPDEPEHAQQAEHEAEFMPSII